MRSRLVPGIPMTTTLLGSSVVTLLCMASTMMMMAVAAQEDIVPVPGLVTKDMLTKIRDVLLPDVRQEIRKVATHDPSLEPAITTIVEPTIDVTDAIVGNLILALQDPTMTSSEDLATLDAVIAPFNYGATVDAYHNLVDGTESGTDQTLPKFTAGAGGEVVDTAAKALGVAADAAEEIPGIGTLVGLARQSLRMIAQQTKEIVSSMSADEQIERKLENIGERFGQYLTGEPIPVHSSEPYTPPEVTLPERLDELRTKLDNLGERAGLTLLGRSIPVEPDTTFVPPDSSLLERLEVLRQKIDNFANLTGETLVGFPLDPEPDATNPPLPPHISGRISQLQDKAELLRLKIDNLAAMLGQILVGFPLDPEPFATNPTFPPNIKEEMHGLELNVDIIIDFITNINVDIDIVRNQWNTFIDQWNTYIQGGGGVPNDVKRIRIYAQDKFLPTASTPSRQIIVSTPAFALTGWVDLTEMRKRDKVVIDVFVSIDGGQSVRNWRREVYTGVQKRGLKHFHEFSDGIEEMGADLVVLEITHTRSASQFKDSIAIGYQLIVETANGSGPVLSPQAADDLLLALNKGERRLMEAADPFRSKTYECNDTHL